VAAGAGSVARQRRDNGHAGGDVVTIVVEVDFLARRRTPNPDTKMPVKVEHTDWCQPDQCVIGHDGGVVHRRLIGTTGDVKVTVERNDDYGPDWDLRMSSTEVYVHGNADFGLTREQVSLLAGYLVDANVFVAQLGQSSAVS
jgi:hypothetical protein